MEIKQPELIEYGIHNEASNIRAHVAVLAKMLYVFPTICGVRAMKAHPIKQAKQPGCEYFTASGHCVPPDAIENIRRLKIADVRLEGFDESLTTTQKGDRAVAIVEAFLKAGRFPLWLEGEFITDAKIQRTGTDLAVNGKWKIEVKCDYKASDARGVPDKRCTGNLYLQVAELNPFKRK